MHMKEFSIIKDKLGHMCTPSFDSKLYSMALIEKAYIDLINKISDVNKKGKFCNLAQKLIIDCEGSTLREFTTHLKCSRSPMRKELLNTINKLFANRDTLHPHIDLCFTLLLAMKLSPSTEMKNYSIPYSVGLGRRFTRLASLTTWGGIDEVLYDLRNNEDPISKNLFSQIISYDFPKGELENHLHALQNQIEQYKIKCPISELLVKRLMNKDTEDLLIKKRITLLLLTLKHSRFRAGSCYISKDHKHELLCNLWTVFFNELWKSVLVHELIESVFLAATSKVERRKPRGNALIEIEKHSIEELRHSLVQFFVIETASQSLDMSSLKNVLFGFIPFGQIMGVMWLKSLENKWSGISLDFAQVLTETNTKNLSNNAGEHLIRILELALKKQDAENVTIKDVPDSILFSSHKLLNEWLGKSSIKEQIRLRVRKSGVARCIFIMLAYSTLPLSSKELAARIKKYRKLYDLDLYMPPNETYTEKEIQHAAEMLSNLSIIKKSKEKFGFPLL